MEESFAKRRKINHGNDGSLFEASSAAVSAMGSSGASAFVLETEELLKEVKLDHSKAFPGLDDTLRQFKDAIEALEPHDPTPVCQYHALNSALLSSVSILCAFCTCSPTVSRLQIYLLSSKRPAELPSRIPNRNPPRIRLTSCLSRSRPR